MGPRPALATSSDLDTWTRLGPVQFGYEDRLDADLNLFPNIACSLEFFRVLQPIAVNETEIHHAVITMDGGPAVANRYRLRLHEHFQGPMGFGTPDDSEAWERVQRGASAGTDRSPAERALVS